MIADRSSLMPADDFADVTLARPVSARRTRPLPEAGRRRMVRRQSRTEPVDVTHTTGPCGVLLQETVLVIADAQNLDHGARDLGFRVSWSALGDLLDATGITVERHVVLSRQGDDERRTRYFALRGWVPHAKQVRNVWVRGRWERRSNADARLLYVAGQVVPVSGASLVLIASGDGDLVEELAEAVASEGRPRRVATLSLAGSTATRLNAATSPLIAANIELGLDCLRKS